MTTKKVTKKKHPLRDVRTLCYRCRSEMRSAGIELQRAGGARSSCDKCNRPGSSWEVK